MQKYKFLTGDFTQAHHLVVHTEMYDTAIADLPDNLYHIVFIDLIAEINSTSFYLSNGWVNSTSSHVHVLYEKYIQQILHKVKSKMARSGVVYFTTPSNLLGISITVIDAIFGQENRLEVLTWEHGNKTGLHFSSTTDFILVVVKNKKYFLEQTIPTNPDVLRKENCLTTDIRPPTYFKTGIDKDLHNIVMKYRYLPKNKITTDMYMYLLTLTLTQYAESVRKFFILDINNSDNLLLHLIEKEPLLCNTQVTCLNMNNTRNHVNHLGNQITKQVSENVVVMKHIRQKSKKEHQTQATPLAESILQNAMQGMCLLTEDNSIKEVLEESFPKSVLHAPKYLK